MTPSPDPDHEPSQLESGDWCCGTHEYIADLYAENWEDR